MGTGLEGRTRAAAAREQPDWAQALAAHDCLAQRAASSSVCTFQQQQQQQPPMRAPAAASSMLLGGGGGALSANAAVALQKLDLGHVLGAYLAGLQVGW